jgi:hypothetical protein
MHEPTVRLPDLTPPPGGLERLRQRIEADRSWRRPAWAGFAATACGLAMLALILLPGWLERERMRGELARAVHRAVQPVGPGELRVIDGAALMLESGQPDVRLYLVQSTRPGSTAPPR